MPYLSRSRLSTRRRPRAVGYTAAVVVALWVLISAAPILVGLAHALVPLIVAVGFVAVLLRLAWYFTSRY